MKAAVIRELPTTRVSVEDVEDVRLQHPQDLLLQVETCGICGTDLHILAGDSYRPTLPFVLGHEPVGTVIAVGAEPLTPWIGRRITVTLFHGCGVCTWCQAGEERLCPQLQGVTGVLDRWGGFAEKLVVQAGQAVEVPSSLSSAAAAALVDAGTTAINAARIVVAAKAQRIVVVGGGPVGFLVAERLALAGSDLVVVERQAQRRDALVRLGHRAVARVEDVDGVPDVVIDCAGAPEIVSWALDALAPRGLFVAVGYGVVPRFDLAPIARKELTIRGVRSGSRADLLEALDLTASNQMRIPSITTWPLDQINDGFNALREGEVTGKAVIALHD